MGILEQPEPNNKPTTTGKRGVLKGKNYRTTKRRNPQTQHAEKVAIEKKKASELVFESARNRPVSSLETYKGFRGASGKMAQHVKLCDGRGPYVFVTALGGSRIASDALQVGDVKNIRTRNRGRAWPRLQRNCSDPGERAKYNMFST